MVDVNTVVGEPIETPDGHVIVPVSRVVAGFAAGGSEYESGQGSGGGDKGALPFGGGSGAAVSVQPVGFLVVGRENIRLLPVDGNAVVDRVLDITPQVLEKIQQIVGRGKKETEKGKDKEKGNGEGKSGQRPRIIMRPSPDEEDYET